MRSELGSQERNSEENPHRVFRLREFARGTITTLSRTPVDVGQIFPIVICMRQSLQRRRRWRCSLIWWIKSSRAYVEPLIPTPVIGRMYSRECASWPEFDAFGETIPPRVRIWRYARAFKTLFGWNGQWCERIMDNDQWNINKNKRKGRRAFADGGNNRNDFSL